MSQFKHLILPALLAVCQMPVMADTMDAEGYPVLSLRGEKIGPDGQWQANTEGYVFSRSGNEYSLHVDRLEGQFKVSGDNWDINFGAESSETATIYDSTRVKGVGNGENYSTAGTLSNVDITFTYDRDNWGETEITFIVDGHAITTPKVPGLSGSLPVLYINVYGEDGSLDNEVISYDLDHKNYFSGEYWLETGDCEWLKELGATDLGSEESPLPLQIKARGNWTRIGFSKKPFKLKLDKKQSMLGMSKSKHYAILAHADDNYGYLRNFTGFALGQRIGLPWTPSQQPVEVVINGNYRGLYFLTESIRIDEDRVNITELADGETDSTLCSGGYLVELDNYDEAEDAQIQMEEKTCVDGHYMDVLRVTFDTPEVYSDLMRRFVTEQFSTMNDYIGSNDDRIWQYLDLDDAARYYIVEEMLSHVEAYHGSTYLFRDKGEGQKWHFSPLWDCGNAFNGSTSSYFYDDDPYGNTWIPSLRANATFNAKVKATWQWFMQNEFDGLYSEMEQYASRLESAAKADRQRWANEYVPYGGQQVCDNTDISGRLNEAKSKLSSKISWLKEQPDFGEYTSSYFAEPARDTTSAAPLPSYVALSTDVIAVEAADADATYYTLQGFAVENPAPGQTYIKVAGGKGTKVFIR